MEKVRVFVSHIDMNKRTGWSKSLVTRRKPLSVSDGWHKLVQSERDIGEDKTFGLLCTLRNIILGKLMFSQEYWYRLINVNSSGYIYLIHLSGYIYMMNFGLYVFISNVYNNGLSKRDNLKIVIWDCKVSERLGNIFFLNENIYEVRTTITGFKKNRKRDF